MSDAPAPDSDPPRREFRFKPREFTIENPPASTPSAHGPTDVREHLLSAEAAATAKTGAAPRENEVHGILRDNLARANAAGLNDVKPVPRRRSRRKRDYWLVLLTVDAVFVACALIGRNPIASVYGFAGVILFSIGLTWIMWFVMDDY